ncbi:MAG TPA: hypothetical protein DD473_20240, partial [Planctomycetaceae bacterium]|nr:hypothetical protein [Planctomycetaceae bacterium]
QIVEFLRISFVTRYKAYHVNLGGIGRRFQLQGALFVVDLVSLADRINIYCLKIRLRRMCELFDSCVVERILNSKVVAERIHGITGSYEM